jgi:hypothetical protein
MSGAATIITPRELCLHAWAIARDRFPYLSVQQFTCPWPIHETKLPPKGARARVDEICYSAAALWLDKLTAIGGFDKGGITAGRLRHRILQSGGVAVPRAVILAVAVSKSFDIHAGEYDVWIARPFDDYAPV